MCNNVTVQLFGEWKLDYRAFQTLQHDNPLLVKMLYNANRYWHLGYYAAVIYIPVIFGLERLMKSRPAYKLRLPLFMWNASLAIFSVLGFFHTAPYLLHVIKKENGIFNSVCNKEDLNPTHIFWALLFGISKVVELGDTLFIVLRKRPLIILQWYHHLMTLTVTVYLGSYMEPILAWCYVLNFGVHSMMYSYFAAKTIGVRVPTAVVKMLTSFQFIQMVIILSLNTATMYWKVAGYECFRKTNSIIAFNVMFGSFVIIFGKLFINSVVNRKHHFKQH